jgi:hypothetical protein
MIHQTMANDHALTHIHMSNTSKRRVNNSGSGNILDTTEMDYFGGDTYDETIATYLAQCDPPWLADNHLLLVQPANAEEGGENTPTLLQKVGVSLLPTIWLANLSCNFRSACEFCACDNTNAAVIPAPATTTTCDIKTTNDSKKGANSSFKDTSPSSSSTTSTTTTSPSTLFPCIPREFTSTEHHRFDALQRTYHTALQLQFNNSMEGEGGKNPILQSSRMYQLSPRLIIHDPRKRSLMKHQLISYLENRARDMEGQLLQDLEQEMEKKRRADEEKERRIWKRNYLRLEKKKEMKPVEEVAGMITAVQSTKTKTKKKKSKKKNTAKKKQPSSAIDSSEEIEKKELLMNDSSSTVHAWCCDYCMMATFPTFDEAVQHEILCQQIMERNNDTNTVEADEKDESDSSDGEGEIIGRILKNQSDRLLASSSGVESTTSSSSSISGGEESNESDTVYPVALNVGVCPSAEDNQSRHVAQLVPDAASVVASDSGDTFSCEQIKRDNPPMVAMAEESAGKWHGKICDLPKENECPSKGNKPLKLSSPALSPVDSTLSVPLSDDDIERDFMKTPMIDYENRVNDTALPEPCHIHDREPDDHIVPTLIYENAKDISEPTKDDDAASSLRLSSITYQNKILSAQNNFLTQQNQTLLVSNEELQCQLAAVKRQTVEGIQQVQLKAYIAETALCAARDRASVIEDLLVDIVSDIAANELAEREIREAIATYSSMMMAQKNHESARMSLANCTASPPLSPQHESSKSSPMISHRHYKLPSSRSPFSQSTMCDDDANSSNGIDSKCTTLKDFWKWMLRSKTNVGES